MSAERGLFSFTDSALGRQKRGSLFPRLGSQGSSMGQVRAALTGL